uniref:Uncharacterized protein n=1 Tax=Mustela putorius furo TaxID=9669 RepID=M3XQ95_MUSPF
MLDCCLRPTDPHFMQKCQPNPETESSDPAPMQRREKRGTSETELKRPPPRCLTRCGRSGSPAVPAPSSPGGAPRECRARARRPVSQSARMEDTN